jgi:pimeloyl-ACP methyl ester carboxylesterase
MRPAATLLLAFLLATPAHAADSFPPPGKLIDIGGSHKIHLNCTGKGSPTVILIPGASSFSIDFALVQPAIARSVRVCGFDRASHGWSDSFGVADDAEQVVRDLRDALSKARERGPYLLVGQSLGSRFARLYYARHASDVAGIVLVDGEHEDGLFVLADGKPAPISSLSDAQFVTANPPASAPPQQVPEARLDPAYRKLPQRLQQVHLWLLMRFLDSMRSASAVDVDAFRKANHAALVTLHQIDAAEHPLGDVPLIVLSAGLNDGNLHRRLQADLARMSTNSRLIVVDDSDHEIHLFRPDVVIRAVDDVARAVRTRTRLQ